MAVSLHITWTFIAIMEVSECLVACSDALRVVNLVGDMVAERCIPYSHYPIFENGFAVKTDSQNGFAVKSDSQNGFAIKTAD